MVIRDKGLLLFHFYFVYLSFFSPLPGASSQMFVNFDYLLKEPAHGFIDYFYCFINFYFIDFLFDLYNFLPSADFRFCLFFFFYSFRCWDKLSISAFSSTLRKVCIVTNILLRHEKGEVTTDTQKDKKPWENTVHNCIARNLTI